MELIRQYKNGNGDVSIYGDGTRVIEYEDKFVPEYPLNIDIRLTNRCSFGKRPDGKINVCDFCHESATTNGQEGDIFWLFNILYDSGLPQGTELAIGGNSISSELIQFTAWASYSYICNLTVNQGHVGAYQSQLKMLLEKNIIRGLGISYRSRFDIQNKHLQDLLAINKNIVFHVIAGIDNFNDVIKLAESGVKKILILGEKDFGFNSGKVDLETQAHKQWYWNVRKLFDAFEVVSFDNLALEQLKPERFMSQEKYDTFYQGEHSFYINAVDKYFSPSSRSPWREYKNLNIKSYFQSLNK